MSIYGNPVYLGQEGGGGGSAEILLNELKSQPSGSGQISLVENVPIINSGTYFVAAHGYATSATVKINDVTQPMSFSDSGGYTYWYEEIKTLSAGDVVDINIQSSGRSALSAQVIRLS